MHIIPGSEKPDSKVNPDVKGKEAPKAEKPQSVFHYRMDELAKAGTAVHLAADVIEDEHQIAKLKKAEKLAKEVHEKAKAAPPAPKAKEGDKKATK